MKKVTKKILWAGGIIFLCLFIIYLSFLYLTHLKIKNGDLIKWDNKWYTKEQLEKKYPPQEYEIESKNTPEETYSAFRQALLDDDIEEALSMITEDKREMYREFFNDKEKLKSFKSIPEVGEIIKREKSSIGNFAYYYYESLDADNVPYEIGFEKNLDGYWEIDSI
jgi:pyruvate/2-oxoacid:ferredoxin oxidoreductase alpha subunit